MINKKIIFIIISAILIIGIIGIVFFLTSSDVAVAQLIIDSGTVEIKQGSAAWTLAENGMMLSSSDSIRTNNNSTASIILFESSIIRLDNNTQITLSEIMHMYGKTDVQITQEKGRTWNTVLKISGIDTYEVHTPTAVASVRGTTFFVQIEQNGTIITGVTKGVVNVTSLFENTTIDDINVSENEVVIISFKAIQDPLNTSPLIMNEWIIENLKKDGEFIEEVSGDLYERIENYIPELKQKFGITDEELDALIEGYLNGYYDLPPDTPEWIRDIIELT